MNASNWKTIMNNPNFDFVNDIRSLNFGNIDIYELFGEWEYSDERLAILRECYNGKITESLIQEWKEKPEEEEEKQSPPPANLECCEMCGHPCEEDERRAWFDYNNNEILYCDGCYIRMIERMREKLLREKFSSV